TSGRAVVLTRLVLQPEVGSPEQLDVQASAPVPGAWPWKTVRGNNQVRAVQPLEAGEAETRLLALGARTPLETAVLLAVPPRSRFWRLTLARPLREPLVLEATLDVSVQELSGMAAAGTPQAGPAPTAERSWNVPLITVPAADHLEGEVTLR